MISGKSRAVLFAALTALYAGSSSAGEGWSEPARYPEGALNASNHPIWTEMRADRVVTRVDGQVRELWRRRGCGPTSVQPSRDGWWVLCHLSHRVWRLDSEWQAVARYRVRRPNDAETDGQGGLYLTSSGEFSQSARPSGKVLHLSASGQRSELLGQLRYANGITRSADGGSLFVSEHLGRRVLKLPLVPDATASPGAVVFFDLDRAPASGSIYALAGPDGLMTRPDGGLIVAEYGAGRLLWVSPDGRFEASFGTNGDFVTNLAALPEGLLVTASRINDRAPFAGTAELIGWSALSGLWPTVTEPAGRAPDTADH